MLTDLEPSSVSRHCLKPLKSKNRADPTVLKSTRTITVVAYMRDIDGQLCPAAEPRRMTTEDNAKRFAQGLAAFYPGVMAVSRDIGGAARAATVIASFGSVPPLK